MEPSALSVQDAAARTETEEAMQAIEMNFRRLVEQSIVGIYIIQGDRFVHVNPKLTEIFGRTQEELTSEPFVQFVFEDDRALVTGNVRKRLEGVAESIHYQLRALRGDGRVIHVEVQGGSTVHEGQPAILGTMLDITERKRTEEALRTSEARFVKAFQSNPAAMCITTIKESRFIEVNERYCRLFDHTREELIGRTSLELGLWADPAVRALLMERLRTHGAISDHETHFRRKNGDLLNALISMEVIDFPDEAEPVLVSMFADITERMRAEAKISQMNAELEQRVIERTAQLEAANKELESFSYSISHDLRGPLRAMDGFSRALLEDFGEAMPEEGLRYLQVIRSSAQRMGNLIDDLLSFSRLSRAPLSKRTIDMGGLVQAALEDLRAQREGRSIALKTGSLPACEGDPSLLRQVWVNLLSNAFKYTQKRDGAAVEIGCVTDQGRNVYFVRDNGTGFDMRYANKLFGVFQRLHRAEDYDGTGVGLAIVQRVVHRHGGQVWAEAAVDQGATFHFTLEGGGSP